jgi:hypothetical protein
MSSKTIAKISVFVISVLIVVVGLAGCGLNTKSFARKPADTDLFTQPQVIGKISDPDVIEASGIAASKCQPNVFWIQNDSGNDAYIYAVNASGSNLGTWRVKNAENFDWEDIAEFKDASGKCFIYIGEIGDNDLARQVHTIYRIPEPQVTVETLNLRRKNAVETEPAEFVSFTYGDANHNAETLMVHPVTGDIYVLSKNRSGPSGVYKIAPNFNSGVIQKVPKIAELQVPSVPVGLLTGGDISSDGRRVILCDYVDGYELSLASGDSNFDDIWKQQPTRINLGERDTGEAVAYGLDGNTIFATTEGKNAPIIQIRRK